MLESHFNKVTGLYPATSLKERTPTQVFSSEFCEIHKTTFLQNTSRRLLLFYRKKHFINKIARNSLRKWEKMETACKKNNHKTKTSSLFTSSLHILLLFKNVFISLFSASHDILKTRVFRNNTIPSGVSEGVRGVRTHFPPDIKCPFLNVKCPFLPINSF